MKKTLILAVTLLVVAGLSAFFLALTNHYTADIIAEIEGGEELERQKEIFPDADKFTEFDKLADIVEEIPEVESVHVALKGEEETGYIIKTVANGYGGPMEILVGVNAEGVISGVRIGKNGETAGIGDKVTKPEFYDTFNEMKLTEVFGGSAAGSSVDTISGATVSSSAVITGLNKAADAFVKVVE